MFAYLCFHQTLRSRFPILVFPQRPAVGSFSSNIRGQRTRFARLQVSGTAPDTDQIHSKRMGRGCRCWGKHGSCSHPDPAAFWLPSSLCLLFRKTSIVTAKDCGERSTSCRMPSPRHRDRQSHSSGSKSHCNVIAILIERKAGVGVRKRGRDVQRTRSNCIYPFYSQSDIYTLPIF